MHAHNEDFFGTGSIITRRSFLRTVAAASACSIIPAATMASARKGVKVGAISYSFRALPSSAEEILSYLTRLGLDTVELMGPAAEQFAGAPAGPAFPRNFREMSEAERAEFQKLREAADKEMARWRLTASMDRFKALGKMYRKAGVEIDILKLGDPRWSDAEIDYAFRAAKAVGARGISFEISNDAAKRMGPFATRHRLFTGMHNHTQVADEGFSFDTPLSFSKYNMLNFDIGHYVAALNASPIPVIEKYHDRITHLHLKDRKKAVNGGANLPWGTGDTPIAETLQYLQQKRYPITAMIELEHEIPAGSDVMTEMEKCVRYCREALG